jgi:hypothetical protein
MAEVFDYKKEYKDIYLPKTTPMIIDIPEMYFVAIEGKGNPNEKDGEYQKALEILYGIQYTIKMSKKGKNIPKGYFDYVVPPLEGLWWLITNETFPVKDKSKFNWISIIRLPEFVTKDIFEWACVEASEKKKIDTKNAKFLKIKEGLCVQILHIGAFDEEPKTIKTMEDFIVKNNYISDINLRRRHHEIYLSDPRKIEPNKMKTIIRLPIKKK